MARSASTWRAEVGFASASFFVGALLTATLDPLFASAAVFGIAAATALHTGITASAFITTAAGWLGMATTPFLAPITVELIAGAGLLTLVVVLGLRMLIESQRETVRLNEHVHGRVAEIFGASRTDPVAADVEAPVYILISVYRQYENKNNPALWN